jgi:RecB family endonuclease NucS
VKIASKKTRNVARISRYDQELKMLLRRRLDRLEAGLKIADGGMERCVATGKIDITARDRNGNYVVIELKAGACPVGAMEQVLACSSDLAAETGMPCRSIIVASEFSDRIRGAAKRTRDLDLVTYELGDISFPKSDPAQTKPKY